MENPKRPVVALVATPKFKEEQKIQFRRFAYEHLYTLTSHFDVLSTGNTHVAICRFIKPNPELEKPENLDLIANDLGKEATEYSLERWRDSIKDHFVEMKVGVEGMIEIANELIQGNLDAVIQFSVEDDTTVRAGSAVLRREANVHDVPIASDIATAHAFVKLWKDKLRAGESASSLFRRRQVVETSPCVRLAQTGGDRVLALIAHDGRKHEMGRFVVEYSEALRRFDHILTTGHSGELARQYLGAAGWKEDDLKRIVKCNSGPEGGDVQIAAAVIQGRCHNVVFFQDPATSHPHQADIRLFEQAILVGTKVRLASNAQSARILLDAIKLQGGDG